MSLHSQISAQIRSNIASGKWPANYRLHSEPELAQQLRVSRGTIRRALSTLVQEGLLRQVRGRGTYVTPSAIEPAISQRLTTFTENQAQLGVVSDPTVMADTAVHRCELAEPPQFVAALLDIQAHARTLCLERLRFTAQGPAALMTNYVRVEQARGLETTDFTTASLFSTLEHRFGLTLASARRTFSAELADARVGDVLDLAPGAPVLYLQQVTYLAGGHPIEYSDVWVNTSRLRITSVLARG